MTTTVISGETYRTDRAVLLETDKVKLHVVEPAPGKYCLHCDVLEWSKDIYKELLNQWGEVIEELYKAGIDEVYAIIPEERKGIQKFAEMFGFEDYFGIRYKTDRETTGTLRVYAFPIRGVIEEEAA